MVNVPLSEQAALRVVGYHVFNEGFLTNGFSGADDINDERTNGGRMALLLEPTDRLDVTLSGIYQRSRFGAYYQATDHHPDLIIDQAEPETFIDRYAIGALKVNYDFGGAQLTSASSFFDRKRYFQNDIDYFTGLLGVPRAFSPLTYTSETFTQEVRLASSGEQRLQWLVGAYFEDREESATQSISPAGEPVPPPSEQLAHIHRDVNTRQYAAFGEVAYDVTEKLTLTAGVRASVIEGDNTSVNDGILFGGQTIKKGDNRDEPVSPRFIVSYHPSEATEVYVQASRGFRIGGVNPGLPPCEAANGCTVDVGSTFDPDTVWNYEIGLKLLALDRRLSLDAAAFWIDWDDIQINVGRGDGFNGFTNGGSAVSRGVELALSAQLTDNLRVGGQFTYTDAYLTSLAPGVAEAGFAQEDDDLPQIPPVSTSGFAEWGMGVASDGWFYVRADVQYVDRRFSGFTSNEPRVLPSYTLANLRLGLDKGPYSVALFVNNLTDERAILSDQFYSGVHDGLPYTWKRDNINVPRTIGMSLARRF
jgi:outer membrane receptor protein involved in Fe transport